MGVHVLHRGRLIAPAGRITVNITHIKFHTNASPTTPLAACYQVMQRSQESGVLYFQQQQKVAVHSVNNTNINAIEI